MGLFVRIHYHDGGCVKLMERMEDMEQFTGNPFHILGMVNRGLIILKL